MLLGAAGRGWVRELAGVHWHERASYQAQALTVVDSASAGCCASRLSSLQLSARVNSEVH